MKDHDLRKFGGAHKRTTDHFGTLMARRVLNVLLVASPYDAFLFEERFRVTDTLRLVYRKLNLSRAPCVSIAHTTKEALEKIADMPVDLVIAVLRCDDLDVASLGAEVKDTSPNLPVLLLAYNTRELSLFEDWGRTVHFSPHHPRHLYQFASAKDTLESAQREFLALELTDSSPALGYEDGTPNLVRRGLEVAKTNGVLNLVGSVYSPENDAIYDGTSRPGVPLVTMAGVLKADAFPLADALKRLLKLGSEGFSPGEVSVDDVDEKDAVCISENALGSGAVTDIRDIIYVRSDTFDRSMTVEIAQEIGVMAATLRRRKRPTLLIGPGRWGTRDRFLGIPVTWHQIAGVKCIVETDLEDIRVEPSQGTHFFQNITSLGIGYFSVSFRENTGMVDTPWLSSRPAVTETGFCRHLSFDAPLEIVVNSGRRIGVIMKPGCPLLPAPASRS